jgi:hypothetical protein
MTSLGLMQAGFPYGVYCGEETRDDMLYMLSPGVSELTSICDNGEPILS